jgi:anti-sigma factor RsiW
MSQGFDPFDPEEWGNKPGCSAFEVALEMRRRGALAAAAVPVLDAHLASCDDCRDHAARLGRVDASLVTSAVVPDVRRLREKMDDELRKTRLAPWVRAGIGLVMAVLFQALFRLAGLRTIPVVGLVLIALCLAATGYLGVSMRAHRLRRLLADPDAVNAYRGWLKSNIKTARWLPWALIPNMVIQGSKALGHAHRFAAGERRVWVFLLLEAFVVVGWGGVLVWNRIRVRRVKAELAEMR